MLKIFFFFLCPEYSADFAHTPLLFDVLHLSAVIFSFWKYDLPVSMSEVCDIALSWLYDNKQIIIFFFWKNIVEV